jgi:uncharacterized protein involved in tolerance to divalent cations
VKYRLYVHFFEVQPKVFVCMFILADSNNGAEISRQVITIEGEPDIAIKRAWASFYRWAETLEETKYNVCSFIVKSNEGVIQEYSRKGMSFTDQSAEYTETDESIECEEIA